MRTTQRDLIRPSGTFSNDVGEGTAFCCPFSIADGEGGRRSRTDEVPF
jgi:hypothetical protein